MVAPSSKNTGATATEALLNAFSCFQYLSLHLSFLLNYNKMEEISLSCYPLTIRSQPDKKALLEMGRSHRQHLHLSDPEVCCIVLTGDVKYEFVVETMSKVVLYDFAKARLLVVAFDA